MNCHVRTYQFVLSQRHVGEVFHGKTSLVFETFSSIWNRSYVRGEFPKSLQLRCGRPPKVIPR